MRKFLLFACILNFYSILAAQTKITDNGFIILLPDEILSYTDEAKGRFTLRDYFEYTDPSQNGDYKLPSKTVVIAIPPNTKPEIIVRSSEEKFNDIIPVLNPEAVKENDSTIIYKESGKKQFHFLSIYEIIGYSWFREYYCVVIKINLVRFDELSSVLMINRNIQIEVKLPGSNLISSIYQEGNDEDLQLFINSDIAKNFKGNPPALMVDTTGNWIDYSREYVKIGTYKDALHRIKRSDLNALGVSVTGINPKSFQIFESGNEQNIFVSGEDDGSFDENDFIQFFGRKNYGKEDYKTVNPDTSEYREYLNRYSDTTVYFLTWGGNNGKRAYSISNQLSVSDTLKHYFDVFHFEPNLMLQYLNNDEVANQTSNWIKNKTWYYDWLGGGTRNFNFNLTDIYPGLNAKGYIKLVSGGLQNIAPYHSLSLSLNTIFLDSQNVLRNKQAVLNGNISSGNLIEGQNQISILNSPNGANPNYLAIDWYEIEYPRNLKLTDDSLYFEIKDNFINKPSIIKIGNASTGNLEIYKVKPFLKKISNIQFSSGSIVFWDTLNTNDAYVAITADKIIKPIFYTKKNFVNLRQSRQADYLLLTHPSFSSVSQTYMNQVSGLFTVSTALINVNDIFDEFTYGYPYPEGIKSFVAAVFENWQSPKPEYLNIVGDANYDYKKYRYNAVGVIGGENYVPSFGSPISDTWYSIFNETLPIPSLKTGRIPVNKPEEVLHYLAKLQNNETSPFNEWNKNYLLFSGGKSDFPEEIRQYKAVNDSIANSFIKPYPYAGNYSHFYKTTNPHSDFGPYSPEYISNAIKRGGVFISYLGHSGTATWDNSISETVQLKNDFNKNPLMTDFGCSTNKFGEPDIVSFGERFIVNDDGQALGYVANSSLGFTSTAVTAPIYFYESLLKDSIYRVGSLHQRAKEKLLTAFGNSNIFRVFTYTNTLLGDPIAIVKVPQKPNLHITPQQIFVHGSYLNENIDSVEISIAVKNLGTALSESVLIEVNHLKENIVLKSIEKTIPLPAYEDTIKIWINIKNLAGEHTISVTLDKSGTISEIYETDNTAQYRFSVASLAVHELTTQRFENPALDYIKLLNPFIIQNDFSYTYQVSSDENFSSAPELNFQATSFFTKVPLSGLTNGIRYWYRAKVFGSSTNYSVPGSFLNTPGSKFYLGDKYGFENQNLDFTSYANNKLVIQSDTSKISVISAGFYAGQTAAIAKNGINLLQNTFFAGMAVAVFDPVTFNVDTVTYFELFNNITNRNRLIELIYSIPQGKIVVMGVADDAANNMADTLRNAIATLGSTKINQLQFRGSWALIGKKGAAPGDVIESVKGPYDGLIYLDTTYRKLYTDGKIITNKIGPSSKWTRFKVNQSLPLNSSVNYKVFGIQEDNTEIDLGNITLVDSTADLTFINPTAYRNIKISGDLHAGDNAASPEINSLEIEYNGLPELGTNYNEVSLPSDTLRVGNISTLNFKIFNAGDFAADSVKIRVKVVQSDSSVVVINDSLYISIGAENNTPVEVNYTTSGGTELREFLIEVDPENKVAELFKNNNIVKKQFFVKADSTPASIDISFDGQEILDGDYVSSKPIIKIELNDPHLQLVNDTSSIKIFINERQVFYNDPAVSPPVYNSANPKMVVTYEPELNDGSYTINVIGRDALGQVIDSNGVEKTFIVSNNAQILYPFNYPNPFTDDTWFTFKLTQVPDELKINVYTVTGRLIRQIERRSGQLNFDFNRIYWDGKDEDGDVLANGLYFYKVTLTRGGEKQSITQKLVKMK